MPARPASPPPVDSSPSVDARHERGEKTRADIIEAATHLFARRGYHGTSMRDLADSAGISKALLHHHFGSKDALYQAVREQHQAMYRDAVEPWLDESDDARFLTRALDARIEFYRAHPELARIALWGWLEGSPLGPPSNPSLRMTIEDRLNEVQEAGLLRKKIDTPSLLALISAGILLWDPLRDQQHDRDDTDADALYWDTFTSVILRGAGTKKLQQHLSTGKPKKRGKHRGKAD